MNTAFTISTLIVFIAAMPADGAIRPSDLTTKAEKAK